MITLLTIVHVLVCLALISIVLLQHGKGADIGAAFGGSSQTVFGTSGAATLLGKLTAGAAILFMVTTLGLSVAARNDKTTGNSVVDQYAAPAAPVQSAPLAPPPPVAPAAPETQPQGAPK